MSRVLVLVALLFLIGCTIGDHATLQTADEQPMPFVAPVNPKAPPLPIPAPTAEELQGLCADVPRPQPVLMPEVKSVVARKGKPQPVIPPTKIVLDAQKSASVEPNQRGYYGNSAEQAYIYEAGKIYKVYLHPNVTTGLFLPPGEKQISGLRLDGDKFDVEVERGGKDAHAYDSFRITPKVESGEYKTPLITESGRRYLLHFVIVKDEKVGMAAVSFELQRTGR